MYPNPVRDDVFINAGANIQKIEVNSILGRLIRKYGNINRTHFSFSVKDLPKGTYFVRVFLNNDYFVKKVIDRLEVLLKIKSKGCLSRQAAFFG